MKEFTSITDAVDGPMLLITVVCCVLLVLITGAMIYFAIRYSRRRNRVASEIHGHAGLEIAWTVIPTLIAFGFFWYGWVGYKYMKDVPGDAMNVEVTGRMWSWTHEYENGVTSPELNVPVGRPVKLNLTSTDVIHSYYIPAFKIKQDVVAGIDGLYLWFRPDEVGTYDVFCAEYCGLQHYDMRTHVNVMTESDFNAWLQSEGAKVAEMASLLASDAGGGDDDGANLRIIGEQLATAKGCIACHTSDGTVLIAPSFKGLYGKTETVIAEGKERQVEVNDEYIRQSILDPNADLVKGFQPLMPPQRGLITDEEIGALIAYIKSLQ